MKIRFSQALRPGHIDLRLASATREDAVADLLGLLSADDRVLSIDKLRDAVVSTDAPAIEENGTCICIAHGRTDAVRSLVMAAGKLARPFALPGMIHPLRLVFVAGIPAAFNNDYLLLVGAIARICSSPERARALLETRTPQEFLGCLEEHLERH